MTMSLPFATSSSLQSRDSRVLRSPRKISLHNFFLVIVVSYLKLESKEQMKDVLFLVVVSRTF